MRKQSPGTELRELRREVREAGEQILTLQREAQIARGQLTKAQQDASEWQRRFDALLIRVPLKVPLEP